MGIWASVRSSPKLRWRLGEGGRIAGFGRAAFGGCGRGGCGLGGCGRGGCGGGSVPDDEGDDELDEFISEQSFSRELILVVDDLKDMRTLISNCLKKRSYPVITAKNAEDALEVITKRKPRLIICD